jgi:hypothetical protein
VSALRVPGSELRDALLPVGAVAAQLKPSENTSFEALLPVRLGGDEDRSGRQLLLDHRPRRRGATKVMLGFGAAPDTIPVGAQRSRATRSARVPRAGHRDADDGGQYGAALRLFARPSAAPSSASTTSTTTAACR